MARPLGIWFATAALGVAIATCANAQESETPASESGIVVCFHFGPPYFEDIVLEVIGEDSAAIADVIRGDLYSTGVYRIVDPTQPDSPDPDAIVRVSTNRLEDGSISVDVEMLDLRTREQLDRGCVSTGAATAR